MAEKITMSPKIAISSGLMVYRATTKITKYKTVTIPNEILARFLFFIAKLYHNKKPPAKGGFLFLTLSRYEW
jgi:hypothetical protein